MGTGRRVRGKAEAAGDALVKKVTPAGHGSASRPRSDHHPAEADSYLAEMRARIVDALDTGHPVSIK